MFLPQSHLAPLLSFPAVRTALPRPKAEARLSAPESNQETQSIPSICHCHSPDDPAIDPSILVRWTSLARAIPPNPIRECLRDWTGEHSKGIPSRKGKPEKLRKARKVKKGKRRKKRIPSWAEPAPCLIQSSSPLSFLPFQGSKVLSPCRLNGTSSKYRPISYVFRSVARAS